VPTEDNKALVRRLFAEAINGRDLAVLDELVAAGVVTHTPVPGTAPGLEGFRRFVGAFLDAFPDQRTELHEVVAEGDRVAVLHTHRGTHGGELMGMPPTAKPFAITGIELFRIADGRIAEFWHQDDLLGLMQQLGAAPGPGQPSS
jgi:steroid delta-isomerase-like uncharacterized protein